VVRVHEVAGSNPVSPTNLTVSRLDVRSIARSPWPQIQAMCHSLRDLRKSFVNAKSHYPADQMTAVRRTASCQYGCIDTVLAPKDTRFMVQVPKTRQLQIRVSSGEKQAIRHAAKRAGMDMSSYVLSRVLSAPALRFLECVAGCNGPSEPSFALAELNTLLSALTPGEMREATAAPPSAILTPFLSNYVAAMVEHGCARCGISPPAWTHAILPLDEPVFGTSLQSLRLHLLTHSPPPFRRRNIFIDSSLGRQI
jgi:hypothetical protein